VHWQHPSFFAYFPAGSNFGAILGDLYASSVPNPGFNVMSSQSILFLVLDVSVFFQWSASPACTELEAVVMDWAAKMFGLDQIFYNTSKIGGGVIQVNPFLFFCLM